MRAIWIAFAGLIVSTGLADGNAANAEPTDGVAVETIAVLAAMPEAVESVMIWDVEAARGAQPALLAHFNFAFIAEWEKARRSKSQSLRDIVHRAALEEGVAFYAAGGSHFHGPAGIGVGDYDERVVFEFTGTTRSLRATLDSLEPDSGVRRNEVDGITLYEGEIEFVRSDGGPVLKTHFVVVRDDKVVVAASRRSDAIRLATAPLSGVESAPAKWNPFADEINADEPMLVVRIYDRMNAMDAYSPVNPKFPAADVTAIAVTATDDGASLRIRCVTSERSKAIKHYRNLQLHSEYFRWSDRKTEDGFTAVATPVGEEQGRFVVPLALMTLYGVNYAF